MSEIRTVQWKRQEMLDGSTKVVEDRPEDDRQVILAALHAQRKQLEEELREIKCAIRVLLLLSENS